MTCFIFFNHKLQEVRVVGRMSENPSYLEVTQRHVFSRVLSIMEKYQLLNSESTFKTEGSPHESPLRSQKK